MPKDKLLIFLIFVLACGGAVLLGLNGRRTPADPIGRPPQTPAKTNEFLGMCLQMQSGWQEHPYDKFTMEIAATGANTICFVVAGFQENGASTSIFLDVRKGPWWNRLEYLIRHAKKQGLRVVFMPIVLLENPRESEWRGKIKPTDWDRWWQNYNALVMYFAPLCQSAGVDVYIIGSELVSTEGQTERWRSLIKQVRSTYKGRLSYSANWDHYRNIKWWKDLDLIGMTTYYDLSGGKDDASYATLMAEWAKLKTGILAWQRTVNRPIIFTEVGWPNQSTAAEAPWNYYGAPDDPAPELQARCFKAFFDTWDGEDVVAGSLVWEWRSWDGEGTPVGPEDTSYTPCGKPAIHVIGNYFKKAGNDRNPATQPTGERQDR